MQDIQYKGKVSMAVRYCPGIHDGQRRADQGEHAREDALNGCEERKRGKRKVAKRKAPKKQTV